MQKIIRAGLPAGERTCGLLLTEQLISDTIPIAAAVINEFIAVIAAKKGFELAGEIERPDRKPV